MPWSHSFLMHFLCALILARTRSHVYLHCATVLGKPRLCVTRVNSVNTLYAYMEPGVRSSPRLCYRSWIHYEFTRNTDWPALHERMPHLGVFFFAGRMTYVAPSSTTSSSSSKESFRRPYGCAGVYPPPHHHHHHHHHRHSRRILHSLLEGVSTWV